MVLFGCHFQKLRTLLYNNQRLQFWNQLSIYNTCFKFMLHFGASKEYLQTYKAKNCDHINYTFGLDVEVNHRIYKLHVLCKQLVTQQHLIKLPNRVQNHPVQMTPKALRRTTIHVEIVQMECSRHVINTTLKFNIDIRYPKQPDLKGYAFSKPLCLVFVSIFWWCRWYVLVWHVVSCKKLDNSLFFIDMSPMYETHRVLAIVEVPFMAQVHDIMNRRGLAQVPDATHGTAQEIQIDHDNTKQNQQQRNISKVSLRQTQTQDHIFSRLTLL